MNGSFSDATPFLLAGGMLAIWILFYGGLFYFGGRSISSCRRRGGELLMEPIRIVISAPSVYPRLVMVACALLFFYWLDSDPEFVVIMVCGMSPPVVMPFVMRSWCKDAGWLELYEHGIVYAGGFTPWSEIKRYRWVDSPSLRLALQYRTTRFEVPVPPADREEIDVILSEHIEQESPVPVNIGQGHA